MERKIEKVLGRNPELGTSVEKVKETSEDSTRYFVIKRIRNISLPLCQTIFKKETEALERLKGCENIVHIYKHEIITNKKGESEGVISMEFIDGQPLKTCVDQIPNVSTRFLLAKQLLNAVQYAHNNGVIHRDINPSNILITDDYKLKLIDFGISKIYGTLQDGTTYQFATHNYSAPEVTLHSENASEQSDIFSIGAVLFFLFTGKIPPSADELCEAIEQESGIDVTVKPILLRMCAFHADDRYKSIDQCKDALAIPYAKYCSNDENYYFVVNSTIIEKLRSQHLIRKFLPLNEVFNDYLPKQFVGCYASVATQKEGIYRFDGNSISIECVFLNDVFNVTSVQKLETYKKEQRKRYAFEVSGHCLFFSSMKPTILRNNYSEVLCNRIEDHRDDIASQQNIDREYEKQYGILRKFIQAMIQDAADRAEKIPYVDAQKTDGELHLSLDENCFISNAFNQETIFIIEDEQQKGKKKRLLEIGSFIRYQDDGRTLVIKPTSRNLRIPHSGQLSVDYRKEIQQYRRQEAAYEAFRKSETNNNLKSILVGVEEPRTFQKIQLNQYFNKKLDLTQRHAVYKILCAEDIAMVQGPPGTGKTNVLVEAIRQILYDNKTGYSRKQRILIVSQSHAAVDRILEDIDDFIDKNTTVIRIGNEDRIDPKINNEYGLRHRNQIWVNQSTQSCNHRLQDMLNKLGVSFSEFEEYAQDLETLQIVNPDTDKKEKAEHRIQVFEEKYADCLQTPSLQRCLILSKWCRRLEENDDLSEYYIKDSEIIAGTCSGFIADPYVRDIVFDYVFIDEAAKATLSEIMVPMVRAQKVILVGDHKQLSPVINREALENAGNDVTENEVRNVGFGKLFEMLPNEHKETLTTQYRMHPCIGDLISLLFYNGRVQSGVTAEDRSTSLPIIMNKAITWISTSKQGENRFERMRGQSFENELEASIVLRVLKQIDIEMEGLTEPYTIGVITPYRAQLEKIRKRIPYMDFMNIHVDVNTVDAFQGSQRDIIVYSTVRSSRNKRIGFLKEQSRLNVSFSRARRALIIIGDSEFLDNSGIRDNVFPSVLQYMRENSEFCRILDSEDTNLVK